MRIQATGRTRRAEDLPLRTGSPGDVSPSGADPAVLPSVRPAGTPLEVVVVGDALGLPHGMAATSRVRLYCRALASVGVSVRVVLTTVSESSPRPLNWESRGAVDGVPFEYTTGTPIRAASFLGRRLAEVRGVLVAVARLATLRRNGHPVAVLAYMGTSRCSLRYAALTAAASVMRIPVVLELCEVPWTLRVDRRPWERVFSPLALTSGAITISSFLTSWANAEYASQQRDATATEIPILVDVDEVRPTRQPHSQQAVLYAASSGYDESVAFVLEAMRHVWSSAPHCQLLVTGIEPEELGRHLSRQGFTSGETALVVGVGRVSREALLRLYADASACLAPLFDDQRSRARFPTKIAEYAAAGRPIVTSSVGEVRRYLADGDTAFVAEPNHPVAFGGKIVEALSDPEKADAVGARARGLAEERFDYRVHAARLREALTRGPAANPTAVRQTPGSR